ncbi:MAG: hypothetical protein ACFHWX_02255 [Bacteroidota bacterium]
MMAKNYKLIFIIGLFVFESCDSALDLNPTSFLNEWEISKSEYGFDINPRGLFFVNSKTGFVVGYNGRIYKTINSGDSWQKQNSGTTLHLLSVFFINENIGFASGQAMSDCLNDDCDKGCVFLTTTNGGEIWTKKLFKEYVRIKSLHFFTESVGLALIYTPGIPIPNSRDYHIARTVNGGDSWEFIDLAINPAHDTFYCVDDVVFVAGKNQKIYKSTDIGDNWETITTPLPALTDVGNLYFYNKTIGFFDGGTHIFKTTDGGKDWKAVDSPFSSFDVFHFYSENEGFNVAPILAYEGGDFPTFKGSQSFQTFDGGETWHKSELNDSILLGRTYFPERDLGFGINGSEFYKIKRLNKPWERK